MKKARTILLAATLSLPFVAANIASAIPPSYQDVMDYVNSGSAGAAEETMKFNMAGPTGVTYKVTVVFYAFGEAEVFFEVYDIGGDDMTQK